MRAGLVILDELGRLPCGGAVGALPFHPLGRPHQRTGVIITTNLSFSERAAAFGDAEMTTALIDRIARRRSSLETGKDDRRFKAGSENAAPKKERSPMSTAARPTHDGLRAGRFSVEGPDRVSTEIITPAAVHGEASPVVVPLRLRRT